MQDMRKAVRERTFFGGDIAFNQRMSTMTCVVRNFSAQGALLGFHNTATVPDKFDLVIRQKQRSFRTRMVWRRASEAGVVFEAEQVSSEPMPIEWARRLQAWKAEKAALRRRVEQLSLD